MGKKKNCSRDGGYKVDQDMNEMVLSSRTSSSSKKRHKSKHVLKAKAKSKKRVIGGGNQGGLLRREDMELILKGKARKFPPWAAGSTSKEVSRVSPSPPGSPQRCLLLPPRVTSPNPHIMPGSPPPLQNTHTHTPQEGAWPPKCSVT